MTSLFDDSQGVEVEETAGVRGIGRGRCWRLTRTADGASALVHEVRADMHERLVGAVFHPQPPDFSRPFVTRFCGLFQRRGGAFLVEPLPIALPLLDVWRRVLQTCPFYALPMIRVSFGQLKCLLEDLRRSGGVHGAVCVENVVLTERQTYGLLAAHLPARTRTVWLRPLTGVSGADAENRETHAKCERPETISRVAQQLVAVSREMNDLPPTERRAIETICVNEIDCWNTSRDRYAR